MSLLNCTVRRVVKSASASTTLRRHLPRVAGISTPIVNNLQQFSKMADRSVITEFQGSPFKVNLGVGAPDEDQLRTAMGRFQTAAGNMLVGSVFYAFHVVW